MNTLKSLFSTNTSGFQNKTQKKAQKSFTMKSNPEFQILSSRKSTIFYNKENNQHANTHITPQTLKQIILSQITDQFKQKYQFLYQPLIKWIEVEWKKMRMPIQSRLTKLIYLQSSLCFSTYKEIEDQILIEWKKNILLNGLTYFWFYWLKNNPFKNRRQLQQYLDTFGHIFVTISMRLYQKSLHQAASKGIQIVLKLKRQAFTELITSQKQWSQISEKIIQTHLKEQCQERFFNFDFKQIQMNPSIINVERAEDLFIKTKQSLQKLQKGFKLKTFTQILLEFRQNLLKELQTSIQVQSLSSGPTKKHITVEKEDVINCIIWILVKNKMTWIGGILNYYELLLGNDIDKVLRWSHVDCFRIDIIAAYWFIANEPISIAV